jgi:4-hydroxy-2-oxoheptanedioate aldolase
MINVDTHFYDLANTVASSGASPIIRVPVDEAWLIKVCIINFELV